MQHSGSLQQVTSNHNLAETWLQQAPKLDESEQFEILCGHVLHLWRHT